MFVVILAQSAATARAYAEKYSEPLIIADDLTGLGAANAAAAFSGTFVVNGSPTKAQMVDSAGGRSQLAQLSAAAVVLGTLLLLTGPLAYLPKAALAAVVFLIAIELIDVKELRRVFALRKEEFSVALLTTAAVVALGVEYGIVLAMVASVVDHLRHSYSPINHVLGEVTRRALAAGSHHAGRAHRGRDRGLPVRHGPDYANSARLLADLRALADHGGPVEWLVFDCAAIGDIDYTAATTLTEAIKLTQQRHVRFVTSSVLPQVRQQLDRYGISKALDPGASYETPGEALEAFHARRTERGSSTSRHDNRLASAPYDIRFACHAPAPGSTTSKRNRPPRLRLRLT